MPIDSTSIHETMVRPSGWTSWPTRPACSDAARSSTAPKPAREGSRSPWPSRKSNEQSCSIGCSGSMETLQHDIVIVGGGAAGRIAVRAFGGMSVNRTAFAADKTGFHLLHTLFQTSLQFDRITRYDEFFVTKLLVKDGRCAGLAAIDLRDSEVRCIAAKAVILCTGGLGRIFAFTTNGSICTGDGIALAYRAGVPLKDMEFVQYHPTGLPGTGILMTEASRGEGGYLINNQGRRFLDDYIPG